MSIATDTACSSSFTTSCYDHGEIVSSSSRRYGISSNTTTKLKMQSHLNRKTGPTIGKRPLTGTSNGLGVQVTPGVPLIVDSSPADKPLQSSGTLKIPSTLSDSTKSNSKAVRTCLPRWNTSIATATPKASKDCVDDTSHSFWPKWLPFTSTSSGASKEIIEPLPKVVGACTIGVGTFHLDEDKKCTSSSSSSSSSNWCTVEPLQKAHLTRKSTEGTAICEESENPPHETDAVPNNSSSYDPCDDDSSITSWGSKEQGEVSSSAQAVVDLTKSLADYVYLSDEDESEDENDEDGSCTSLPAPEFFDFKSNEFSSTLPTRPRPASVPNPTPAPPIATLSRPIRLPPPTSPIKLPSWRPMVRALSSRRNLTGLQAHLRTATDVPPRPQRSASLPATTTASATATPSSSSLQQQQQGRHPVLDLSHIQKSRPLLAGRDRAWRVSSSAGLSSSTSQSSSFHHHDTLRSSSSSHSRAAPLVRPEPIEPIQPRHQRRLGMEPPMEADGILRMP